MAGYIRNDTVNNIADGNIINASDLDGEFDAIQAAFVNTTGHTHDGTAAEGAPITKIGPAQDIVASITDLTPKTTNTIDLGTNSLKYKNIYAAGTAFVGTLDLTNALAVADGGSGQTTAQAAMNTFAGAVTSGQYLRGNGTNVVMSSIQAADVPTLNQNTTGTASNVTGVVAAANGGTGQSSYAVGDLLFASTTTALSKLADVATGNAIISGGVGVAPSYGKIGLTTHISGTLPIANGGTNANSTPTSGAIAYGTGTAYAFNTAGSSGQPLLSGGSGAPTFGTLGITSGGTGQTTASAAFNALSPITSTGDLIIGNGVNSATRLAIGANNTVLTSNGTTATWTSVGGSTYVNNYVNRYFTSSTATFTVPSGVTSIRAYAVGKGGDAATFATERACGGGGGGFAFGNIAVTPGASVTITINASSTTVAIGATTYLTANAGSAPASASAGGAGGTASKDVSVTSGGAYTGGTGGATTGNNQCGAGASAGSPLGNGVNGESGANTTSANIGPGGSGIGGAGGFYGGGGGAGGPAGTFSTSASYNGGGSGPQQGNSGNLYANGASRQFDQRFTDPLLAHVDGTGGFKIGTQSYVSAGPGGGGATMESGNSGSAVNPAYAGDFGGGGAANTNVTNALIRGMNGGILGGGGTAYRYGATTAGTTRGGDGGFGGGGGGACLASAASGGTTTQGVGGGGCVVIYY